MHPFKSIAVAVICVVFAAACQKPEEKAPVEPPVPSAASVSIPASNAPQEWLGTWIGQEGMVLKLAAKPDSKYEVIIIYNEDGVDIENTYEGAGGPDTISFERDGIKEQIKATDGEATGLKWLADRKTCLTIKEGEGYCRD